MPKKTFDDVAANLSDLNVAMVCPQTIVYTDESMSGIFLVSWVPRSHKKEWEVGYYSFVEMGKSTGAAW